jgi:hypothetical protein
MCRRWQLVFLVLNFGRDTLAFDEPDVAMGSMTEGALPKVAARFLQSTQSSSNLAINEADNSIFSRPPQSKEETNAVVYAVTAAFGVISVIILLVGANIDSAERQKRRARAIVPEESVPCAIAEQYYLDEHLVSMRSPQDFEARKKRMGLCAFLQHYGAGFLDALSRQHLGLSFFVKAIPTFTRLKRGILIVVHLHVSMLSASLAYNILEHDKSHGKYEMVSCDGGFTSSTCTATLPWSLLVACAVYPFFRLIAVRQMRLTCFVSQFHPSTSQFPLNVRKFARIPAKSARESLFCMRNAYERRQVLVLQSRSLFHRVVQMLWKTTQPSIKDLRFYGVTTSWCILLFLVSLVVCSIVYVILFTAYLKDDVVYHWLAWTLTMFFGSMFILEPLQILFVEVIWCAFVADFAQHWHFGSQALANTTRYKEVVRQVEQTFIKELRLVAAARVQRWWLAVLDMYQCINVQTSMAGNFQAITQKTIHSKKYAKERKWCLKVEVQECYDLEKVLLEDLMSPFIQLQCDTGNPTVMQTKVAWDAHKRATFDETFFVDIKESKAMYVSVWSKMQYGQSDEFIGRGYFEFGQLKSGDRGNPEGQDLKVTLHDLDHGGVRTRIHKNLGCVNLRVKFLDPSREPCGDPSSGDVTYWMLPKHRMQFALSKMGGRMKVSKMLGGLGAPMSSPVIMTVPSSGAMKLDTAATASWQVGGPRINSALSSRSGTLSKMPTSPTASNANARIVPESPTAGNATPTSIRQPKADVPQPDATATMSLNASPAPGPAASPLTVPNPQTSTSLPGQMPDTEGDDGA